MGNVCNSQEDATRRVRDSYRPRKLQLEIETDQVSQEELLYKKRVDKIWKDYDQNQNGKLEKEEAMAFLKQMLPELIGQEPSEELLERNFCLLDQNNSGDIDK